MISTGKRFVIIANGDIRDYDWHRSQLRKEDYMICADGGVRHALAMGIVPQLVLGDFDSTPPEIMAGLDPDLCRREHFPAEKDATDTEMVLDWCLAKDPAEILMMGLLGSRLDHTLANIFLLAKIPEGIKATIINEQNEIFLCRDKRELEGCPGDCLSILPLTPNIQFVSTRGLKYILADDTLNFGSTRGISNEMAREHGSVKIGEGLALVIKAWEHPRR